MKTSVTFLLDRTGSMMAIKKDTIGDFNTYLKGLKEGDAAADTEFTLVTFDSVSIDKVHFNKKVTEVPELTDADYQPRAWTPLIEAAIKTIEAVATAYRSDTHRPPVISIMTDGEENSSGAAYTWQRLNDLIKEKTKLNWQFNFMGVGLDAYAQGAKMGIATANTVSTSMDPEERTSAYRSMGSNAAMYASGASATVAFSAAQKSASGDVYDPALKKATIVASKAEAQRRAAAAKQPKKDIVDDLDLTK